MYVYTLTACGSGEYGPGCSQSCHCDNGGCDRYSGICNSGTCEAGWFGGNCQSMLQ